MIVKGWREVLQRALGNYWGEENVHYLDSFMCAYICQNFPNCIL